MIRVLGLTDTVVCVLLLTAAAETSFGHAFHYRNLCKTSAVLFESSIYTSVFILILITADRYKKVCSPFSRQLSVRMAKYAIVVILIVALILSFRNIVIYDIVHINITFVANNQEIPIPSSYCRNSVDPNLHQVINYSHAFDMVLGIFIIGIFATSYGLILRKLFRQRRVLKNFKVTPRVKNTPDSINKTTELELSSDITKEPCLDRQTSPQRQKSIQPGLIKPEYYITIMMFLVTVVFVVSLVPFFVASLVLRRKPEHALKPYTQLMMRTVFLNSVFNPIIYYIYNSNFRVYVNTILRCKATKNEATDSITMATRNTVTTLRQQDSEKSRDVPTGE